MDNKLQVLLTSSNAVLPTQPNNNIPVFDIYSSQTVLLEKNEKTNVTTDIIINIPIGHVGIISKHKSLYSNEYISGDYLDVETNYIYSDDNDPVRLKVKNDFTPKDENECAQRVDDYSQYPIWDIHGTVIEYSCAIESPAYRINIGDKIAQLIIVPITTVTIEEVETFSDN